MVTNRLKGFDWLAAAFYPLAVILMEAFWVAPWLNFVGVWPVFREPRPALGIVSVIIVLAVSLLLTRIVTRLKLRMWQIQAIIIGSGVLVMLFVIAAEYSDGFTFLSGAWFAHVGGILGSTLSNPGTVVIAMPAIIYLWWRGIQLGQSTSYFRDIYRSFLLGMVLLIILIFIWQVSSGSDMFPEPPAGIGLNVIGFFFFGLLAIAICHLYVMRSSMPREDAALTSVWRWLPIMLGVVGGMVLVGFLAALIFSPEVFDAIGRAFGIIGRALGQVLEWILTPFVYIVAGLVYVFRWFISLLRQEQETPPENGGPGGGPEFGDVTPAELPPWLPELLKWLIVAVLVALVIFILARTISRSRARRAQEEVDETSESLFSWKGLRNDLKEFLNSMRFRRKAPAGTLTTFDPDAPGRLGIREIFKRLQWEGKRSGVARRPHETASEYTERLERNVPESVAPPQEVKTSIDNIKDTYETVRYGETAPPDPRVDNANSLWQNVKMVLRRLRGE